MNIVLHTLVLCEDIVFDMQPKHLAAGLYCTIGKRPTGETSTVNKIVSQDIKIFLHHISRAFLFESYKGWSHIKLLAQ